MIVRTLIDFFPPSARELQMKVTTENIEWARSEKRVFLRQSLEIKLIGQYACMISKQYKGADEQIYRF